MKRLAAVILLLLLAQPPGECKPKVAIIKAESLECFDEVVQGFKEEIGDEMELYEYDMLGEPGNAGRIREIVRLRGFEGIFAVGALAALTVKHMGIPTVYAMVISPERLGITEMEQMCGISVRPPVDLILDRFKRAFPWVRRIGVVYRPSRTGFMIEEAEKASEKLGLEILASPISSRRDVFRALNDLWGRIDALWLIPDPAFSWEDSMRYVLAESLRHKVLTFSSSPRMVEKGALLAVFPEPRDIGRQAARMMRRIASGTPPSQLGLQRPKSCKVAVNLKTAALLGVSLPKEILKEGMIFPEGWGSCEVSENR